jgi:hypothetical protein
VCHAERSEGSPYVYFQENTDRAGWRAGARTKFCEIRLPGGQHRSPVASYFRTALKRRDHGSIGSVRGSVCTALARFFCRTGGVRNNKGANPVTLVGAFTVRISMRFD